MKPLERLKIISGIIASGGPNGVAEQRLMQTYTNALYNQLKKLQEVPDLRDVVSTLEALVDELKEKLDESNAKVKRLETQLANSKKTPTRTSARRTKKPTTTED